MNKYITILISFFVVLICISCNKTETEEKHGNTFAPSKFDKDSCNLITNFIPLYEDGDVNVVVEIPAGTSEKWEVNKSTGKIELEFIDNKPRIVNYLSYPGNYGMIPRTLLSKEQGGDGDPLDVIALGPPIERGSIVKCKIIGVLYLLDRGEQDDKLIAVLSGSPLYGVNSIEELNDNYIGISEILELWFSNYKGPGKMESKGFGDKNSAGKILKEAIEEYKLNY